MADSIINTLVEFFKNKMPNELIVFIISLFPVLELRGGLIAARLLDVDLVRAFIICYIGNMLPIPFILLFIRRIFAFLRDKRGFSKVIEKLEIRAMRKSEKVKKLRNWGLFALVAIPLPGTGGWTGALIAAILDIRMRKSLPIIALGVLTAGIIVAAVSYGIF
ncbi:MAG: small multi-drug export protein [Clostridiales bacterium]|nr:small multi-drug export protein [Clostridiales bacterium]